MNKFFPGQVPEMCFMFQIDSGIDGLFRAAVSFNSICPRMRQWHGKAAKKLLHVTVYRMGCVWVEIKYPKSKRQRERERERAQQCGFEMTKRQVCNKLTMGLKMT